MSSGKDDDAKIQPILSQELFREKIIPILANIFHVRDMQIRLVLLKFFPNYVGMFDQSQLEDVILPLVLLGKANAKTSCLYISPPRRLFSSRDERFQR